MTSLKPGPYMHLWTALQRSADEWHGSDHSRSGRWHHCLRSCGEGEDAHDSSCDCGDPPPSRSRYHRTAAISQRLQTSISVRPLLRIGFDRMRFTLWVTGSLSVFIACVHPNLIDEILAVWFWQMMPQSSFNIDWGMMYRVSIALVQICFKSGMGFCKKENPSQHIFRNIQKIILAQHRHWLFLDYAFMSMLVLTRRLAQGISLYLPCWPPFVCLQIFQTHTVNK